MLIRPHDAAVSEDEWRAFLDAHDFGHFVARGAGAWPIIVPTHFVPQRDRVLLHFARDNPVFEALAADPRAALSVAGDYTYVSREINASGEPQYGIPTSYYAAVQLRGTTRIVDDERELAALLETQMRHFEPDGGHAPIAPGDNPYGRNLRHIRGVELRVEQTLAKFKFGGNKPHEKQMRIADALAARGAPGDAEARAHLLRRAAKR